MFPNQTVYTDLIKDSSTRLNQRLRSAGVLARNDTSLSEKGACAGSSMTTFGARRVTVTQGRQCGFRGRRGRVPPLELPLDNSPQTFSPPADLTSRNFPFYSTIERPSIAVILPRYPGTRITRLIQVNRVRNVIISALLHTAAINRRYYQ